MEIVKLSSKGQIVIPQKIREHLNLKEDSFLFIDSVDNTVMIKKAEIDEDLFSQIKNSLEDIKSGRIRRVA